MEITFRAKNDINYCFMPYEGINDSILTELTSQDQIVKVNGNKHILCKKEFFFTNGSYPKNWIDKEHGVILYFETDGRMRLSCFNAHDNKESLETIKNGFLIAVWEKIKEVESGNPNLICSNQNIIFYHDSRNNVNIMTNPNSINIYNQFHNIGSVTIQNRIKKDYYKCTRTRYQRSSDDFWTQEESILLHTNGNFLIYDSQGFQHCEYAVGSYQILENILIAHYYYYDYSYRKSYCKLLQIYTLDLHPIICLTDGSNWVAPVSSHANSVLYNGEIMKRKEFYDLHSCSSNMHKDLYKILNECIMLDIETYTYCRGQNGKITDKELRVTIELLKNLL